MSRLTVEGARLSSWFNDTGDVTHRYHIGWDRQNMYGHFDIWKITACLQSSVDNLAEILGGFCTFTDNLSCLLPFLRLTDTDSCQREIKMVGVKKAVKSPPSFAAFRNELEAPAVSGYSTVSPPNCTRHCILHTAHCILHTAYCTLGYFSKEPSFVNCCPLEFRGGRKHVREGEKEQKMKALGFSKGGSATAKTCQPRRKGREDE